MSTMPAAAKLSWPVRILRYSLVLPAVSVLLYLAAVEMNWPQQAVLAATLMLLAFCLDRVSRSPVVTLMMMGMSLFATCRYGYWRLHNVVLFFYDSRNRWEWFDAFFILMLVGAEVYAFVILVLGYIQTVWPLHRPPVPLPDDPALWPEVDLLIPTYNEPLQVVRYTALAALNIDWPPEKLHVYILDDGNRQDFRTFAEAANVGYLTRTGNEGAKAGNINRALDKTHAPYVAIFDCDHVPTRSFLQVTVGWFLRDQKLGMLQTPHHFYSPDPFERNLGQFRTIPNEGELFYGIVQDANDFWNASFFCGSCAVLRRTALAEIGGIATATVTEDAHTSLLIQRNGWNTAYINLPQAAGLATESLSGHVSQRVRWARGMVQILRLDNPLFARGLSLPQRLCYFNAMVHFMYALPRLIFLTAPLLYLILGRSNIPGYWAAILAFALPHLVLSSTTNSRIQGMHRHSFWNEIYETVLAPYILMPTLMAMINPRLGKFNVTAKGGVVKDSYFDHTIARPFVFLLSLNLFGLLMAIPRLVHVPGLLWLFDDSHPGTVVMNCVWTFFNVVIVSVATAVARESQQRRAQVRLTVASPVAVVLPNGVVAPGDTSDLSSSGVCVQLAEPVELASGLQLEIVFPLRSGNATLPVVVRGNDAEELRLQFGDLTLDQQALLTEVLYSRADSWLRSAETREPDKPLRSLAKILLLSVKGLGIALRSLFPSRPRPTLDRPALGSSHVGSLGLAALLLPGLLASAGHPARALNPSASAEPSPAMSSPRLDPKSSARFEDQFTLRDSGLLTPIQLRGRFSSQAVNFSLPETEITENARLQVFFRLPTSQSVPSTALRVLLNGTEVAMLTAPAGAEKNTLLQQEVSLPPELLVHQNQITFALPGDALAPCAVVSLQPEGTIEPETRLLLSGSRLPIAADLLRLPLPFLDPASSRRSSVPVVFATPPSPEALQAAGIVASYFGMLAGDHQVLFPVSIGSIPPGNAIFIAQDTSSLPPGVARPANGGASTFLQANPVDPASQILVLAGGSAGQLVQAAQALALRGLRGFLDRTTHPTAQAPGVPSFATGVESGPASFTLPPPRLSDDAPRWANTSQPILLRDAAGNADAEDGSAPLNVYVRLPPDLAFLNRGVVPLTLQYRYNQLPLISGSAAQVVVNGQYVGATLLPSGNHNDKLLRSRMALATAALRPFSNSFSLSFDLRYARPQTCQGTAPPGRTATLLNTSQLDLRGVPHWASLPNLELLANAGFPFTRYADLSQTAVILPTQAAVEEISLYLLLMGHFAAQTGYPALRVQVEDHHALQPGTNQDLLIIGRLDDQPAIADLAPMLPLSFDENGIQIQQPEKYLPALQAAWDTFLGRPGMPADSSPSHFSSMPDAVIAGFASPYASGRSLILFVLPPQQAAQNGKQRWMEDFLRVSQSSDISGSLSVAQNGRFYSYHRLRGSSYYVGQLPWRLRIDRWLTKVPWSIPGGVLACCLPLAFFSHGWLVRRAAERLRGLGR